MALMQWGVDCYTGLPEVDRQHEQLYALVNRLDGAKADRGEMLERVLDDLGDYVRDHFALEEKLMLDAGVDAAHQAEHLAAHAVFVERLGEFRRHSVAGSEAAADEVLAFLTGWLAQHIQWTDRKMAMEIHTRMGTEAPHNMFAHF
ncbi:MAG: hemerythrin family protein [Rhodocyclales bacterium]|nr:hemerythrin family protein [Rhodocyclales bacterium]